MAPRGEFLEVLLKLATPRRAQSAWKMLAAYACSVIEAEGAYLILTTSERGRVALVEGLPETPLRAQRDVDLPQGSCEEEVLKENKSLCFNDHYILNWGGARRGCVCIPLGLDAEVLGALTIFGLTEGVSPQALFNLELAASSAARGIKYTEHPKGVAFDQPTLFRLREIDERLRSSSNLELALRRVAKVTQRIFSSDLVLIYEYLQGKGVRIPPIISGNLSRSKKSNPGIASLGKSSALFEALYRKKPVYSAGLQEDKSYECLVNRTNTSDECILEQEEITTFACVPLSSGSQVVGFIVLCYRSRVDLGNYDKEVIQLIASRAASAIHSTRSRERLTVLHDIGQALSGFVTETIDEVLSLIHEQVSLVMDVTNFFIAFYNERTDTVEFMFAVEDGEKKVLGVEEFAPRRGGNGLTEYVLRHGRTLLVPSAIEWTKKHNVDIIGRSSDRWSWLGVPLIVRDSVIGVMAVQDYHNKSAFSQEDSEILSAIASQAAIAIDNARLYLFQEALFDCMPNAVIAISRKGQVKRFNREAERLLGYSRNEVLDSNVEIFYLDGIEEARRIGGMLLQESPSMYIPTAGRSKKGEKIPISLSAGLIQDSKGGRLGSVGVLEDVRLSSLRGALRNIFELLELLSHETEPNKVAEALLLGCAEILQASAACCLVRIGSAFSVEAEINCDAGNQEEILYLFNKGALRKALEDSGNEVLIEIDENLDLSTSGGPLLAVPMNIKGANVGILLLEVDGKTKKHPDVELLNVIARHGAADLSRAILSAEKTRMQSKLLASSNAIVAGQIASGVSHEVRNGLNNIGLSLANILEMIQSSPQFKGYSKALKKLSDAEKDILGLSSLVERLFRFAGNLEPRKADVYLNEVVEVAMSLTESTARDRKCKLIRVFDSTLSRPQKGLNGHEVEIDATQVQQVVINLILNALDATGSRGNVEVRTRRHEKDGRDTEAEVSVVDFGQGVKPEDKIGIFNPFFTTKKHGTGLGLYISNMIVHDNHKGRIELATRLGKGSKFSVFLPFGSQ